MAKRIRVEVITAVSPKELATRVEQASYDKCCEGTYYTHCLTPEGQSIYTAFVHIEIA